MLIARLAGIDQLGVTPHHIKNGFGDQPVIHHHVGLLHQTQRPEGDQVRVPGTGTHQIDFTATFVMCISIFNRFLQCCTCLFLLTGKQQLCNLPLQDTLPEITALSSIGKTLLDGVTEFLHQPCKLTIGGRNKTLQPCP